jgi:hypothetical protein
MIAVASKLPVQVDTSVPLVNPSITPFCLSDTKKPRYKIEALVYGKVWGVGYRSFVKRVCGELTLQHGPCTAIAENVVRKNALGECQETVKVEATLGPRATAEFIMALFDGPRRANVHTIVLCKR